MAWTDFDFCIVMRTNICIATCYTYKISNPVGNEIIFCTFK